MDLGQISICPSLIPVTTYLDRLQVEFEAVFGNQELLNIFALITLELNHLAHLTVRDNGAITGWRLLTAALQGCIGFSYRTSS